MATVLVYYAHPGHRHSQANRAMLKTASALPDITLVDLYAEYPRHNIDINREQQRLLSHDVVVFQFPLFWYSTPSLLKEWLDLVLEYGFAYGTAGDRLAGKSMMLAVTAAASHEAYSEQGLQRFDLRTFLTPLEQTAALCQMKFLTPYVLFASLRAAEDDRVSAHAAGYAKILTALGADQVDFVPQAATSILTFESLPDVLGEPV